MHVYHVVQIIKRVQYPSRSLLPAPASSISIVFFRHVVARHRFTIRPAATISLANLRKDPAVGIYHNLAIVSYLHPRRPASRIARSASSPVAAIRGSQHLCDQTAIITTARVSPCDRHFARALRTPGDRNGLPIGRCL